MSFLKNDIKNYDCYIQNLTEQKVELVGYTRKWIRFLEKCDYINKYE